MQPQMQHRVGQPQQGQGHEESSRSQPPLAMQHRVRKPQLGQGGEGRSQSERAPPMQQDHQPKHEPGVSNAEAKKPERNSRVVAVVAWALNVLSSVSLIMTNKAVMSTFGFTFATTLTGLHFSATAALGALRGGSPKKAQEQRGKGQELGTGSTTDSGSTHQSNVSRNEPPDPTSKGGHSTNVGSSSTFRHDSRAGIQSSTSSGLVSSSIDSSTLDIRQSQRNANSAVTPLVEEQASPRGPKGWDGLQGQEQQKGSQPCDPVLGEEQHLLPPMAGVGKAQYVLALVLPQGLPAWKLPAWMLPRVLPAWEILWFGVIADVSIASMNFSLMLNSIGFYQISKLSVLPAVCLLEAVLYGKPFSPLLRLAVVLVTLGVGVCVVTDFAVTLGGACVALVAVFSTALQQVLIGALQRKHNVTSLELLSHTAPIQAALLLLLGPLCDSLLSTHSLWTYRLTLPALACIGLSCLLAVVCNLSQYMCLGRFSATSFQVLGNLKTVLVLLSGWLLFGAQLTTANVAGMIIAMGGMMLYSYVAQKERQAKLKAL